MNTKRARRIYSPHKLMVASNTCVIAYFWDGAALSYLNSTSLKESVTYLLIRGRGAFFMGKRRFTTSGPFYWTIRDSSRLMVILRACHRQATWDLDPQARCYCGSLP